MLVVVGGAVDMLGGGAWTACCGGGVPEQAVSTRAATGRTKAKRMKKPSL
nr:hypothetical protein [Kibdelosporangium sp. MJ126-NF4]CTQ95115.1 hypothetical protein [Kibdelosporangium sp. MJ126-NF4]